jgi:hypothetical protein
MRTRKKENDPVVFEKKRQKSSVIHHGTFKPPARQKNISERIANSTLPEAALRGMIA